MFDKELAIEILQQIYQATLTVQKRFEPISTPNYFTDSEYGMENLDKVTENNLLKSYTEIDWKKVKGMRDIISRHYFDVDAEAIFDVCKNHIPSLSITINKIITNLK